MPGGVIRTGLLLLALLTPALARGEEPAVKESVGVSLVQIEATVWPKDPGSDACLGLSKDDFELEVGGKPRPIYAVDAVGTGEEVYTVPGPRPADAPAPGGMAVVLLFDLWHLDLFYTGYRACPHGKGVAFREARRYVEEEFRDGDRLLLVTFAGWPVVHEGWIRTREEGLRALARLERNRQVLSPRQVHSHHGQWIAGMESLFLAMGRYPGRKDVIWLGEDFRFDDVAMRMYEIAGRAQANGVVVSAVDLIQACRSMPGPGCPGAAEDNGGLACTDWRVPVALNPISRDTGGNLYRDERIAAAVASLRQGRRCRYLVSFDATPVTRRRQQKVSLRLRGERNDLSLAAPSAYEPPERGPKLQDLDDALFLLPQFGRGLAAEAAIWPYRASAKTKKRKKQPRWDVLTIARLEHTEDEPWPDELTEITVHVLLRSQSTVHGSYAKQIVGGELAALRAPGASRFLLFPLPDVPSGECTLDFTVTSNVGGISANLRKALEIPLLPGPGEAGPWFLSDQLVRLGDRAVLAPSLDGFLARGEPGGLLGYGCRPSKEAPATYVGSLVPAAGGAAVPVTVGWLHQPQVERSACGWLVGSIAPDLPSGSWTFEPPSALIPAKGGESLEFTVEGGPGEASRPAFELRPRP